MQESVAAFKDFSASDAAGGTPKKKKPSPKKTPKEDAAPPAPQQPVKKESPPQQQAPKPKQPSGITRAPVDCHTVRTPGGTNDEAA